MTPSDVRIAYRRENPSSWNGLYTVVSADFPTGALANGVLTPLFSAINMELRERRLVVTMNPLGGGVKDAQSPPPLTCGAFGDSVPGTFTLRASLSRRANVGLKIKCYGNYEQTLLCDLRPGVYRVPPSTSVEVSLLLSRVPTGAGSLSAAGLQIAAQLMDTDVGPIIRPTQTQGFAFPAGPDEISFFLNPLSRWVDVHARCATFGVAGAPILSAYPSGALDAWAPSVLRDYANQTWFPTGDPVEIYPCSDDTSAIPASYAIQTLGGAGEGVFRQYLEW